MRSIALCLTAVLGVPGVSPAAPDAPQAAVAVPAFFPLELRRVVDLGAIPLANPVTDGRALFVPVRPGTLVAVSLETGEVIWRGVESLVRTPAYARGRLYFVTADTLEAVDAATGAAVWRTPLPSAPASAPTFADGIVVVGLENGDVIAVGAADGQLLWRVAAGSPAGTRPVAGADAVLVGVADGRVSSLARSDGTRRWEQKLGARVTGLASAGDRVYAGSMDNFFYCLDAASGRIKWKWRTGGDLVGEAISDSRRVYFVSLDNVVRALDKGSGVQRWKKPLAARPLSGPLLVDETLVLPGVASELRGAAITTGEAAGRYDLGSELGAAPVFVPGTWQAADLLAAVTSEGSLVLLGRRLSLGMAPLTALPGVPVEATAPPPQ